MADFLAVRIRFVVMLVFLLVVVLAAVGITPAFADDTCCTG